MEEFFAVVVFAIVVVEGIQAKADHNVEILIQRNTGHHFGCD